MGGFWGPKAMSTTTLTKAKKRHPSHTLGPQAAHRSDKKKIGGVRSRLQLQKKKKSSKKWPQDELLNRMKINIGTKIQKKEGKHFEQKFRIIKMA